MRLVFLAAVALVSCTRATYDNAVFRRGKLAYETGTLPAEWKRIRVEDANLAFKHRQGGAIVCNAICGEENIDDVPLDVLVNQALFGVEQSREIEREEFKLDARAALRAHVVGTMDGAPIQLDLVVMKKDNCTFDFQLVAGIDDFPARRPDFERFYKSFRKNRRSAVMHELTLADRFDRGLQHLRGISKLSERTITSVLTQPMSFSDFVQQVELIGQKSTAIAVLTAIFSSMVMTVQFASQLGRFGAKAYVGTIVSLSLVRELGPVLTALMVGGRVGAGIAAELGSMAVTEQIDAIRSMGADPVRKLVVPRVAATVVIMPLLTAMSNVLGVLGAMVVAFLTSDVNMLYFLTATMQSVDVTDLLGGLMKTVFFGFFISVIACHRGLSTTGGTEGVGRATTETVVLTSVVTLIADFVLTSILLQFGL